MTPDTPIQTLVAQLRERIEILEAQRDTARRIACNQYAKRWSRDHHDSLYERRLIQNFADMQGWGTMKET